MMMQDVYVQLLSMLMNSPKLAKLVYIDSIYLEGPFQQYLDIVLSLIKKTGQVTEFDVVAEGMPQEMYYSLLDSYVTLDKRTFERYQSLIISDYKRREAIKLSADLKNRLIDFDDFEKQISEISRLKTVEDKYVTAADMERVLNNPKIKLNFVRYKKFRMLTNVKQNDFVVIAAGTGKGKSAFALNLMNDLCNTYPCIYLNMEMAADECLFRVMGSNTSIPISSLEDYSVNKNSISPDDFGKLKAFMKNYESKRVQIINKSQTLDQVRSIIANNDGDQHFIVFVDHMGLIGAKGEAYERMTKVAKELRKLSLDYNCTIFALCQLNRKSQNSNNEPGLSDLRDSGEVEQSASRVVFLHELGGSDYKVIVAKNRGGMKGDYYVYYQKNIQEFREVERRG